MPAFDRPSAISSSTSRSRGLRAASGSSLRFGRNQFLHKRGIDDRAAPGHPSDAVDEVVDVDDSTLQQVADTSTACEQRCRVIDIDVRRQDEDRYVGELRS